MFLVDYSYSSCQTLFGEYGEDLSCPENESNGDPNVVANSIVEAICGSGRDDDCNGFSHSVCNKLQILFFQY